jgi:hypothetical protein
MLPPLRPSFEWLLYLLALACACFVWLIGHRTSVAGRAMVSFSWTPGLRACSDLVLADFSDRWALANWLIAAARELHLTIKDGRPGDGGLEYLDDVEHLLDDGQLPGWLQELETSRTPEIDDRNIRFAAYSRLATLANRNMVCIKSEFGGLGV